VGQCQDYQDLKLTTAADTEHDKSNNRQRPSGIESLRTFSGLPIPTLLLTSESPLSGHAKRLSFVLVRLDKDQFEASNTAYLPPPPDEALGSAALSHSTRSCWKILTKRFADGLPDNEFSNAGLQGCKF